MSRARLLVAALAAFAPFAAAEDSVVLANGHRLVGSLEPDTGGDTIGIRTPNGVIRLRRVLVAQIERDFESRLAAIDRKDPRQLLDLARWCYDQATSDGKRADLLAKGDQLLAQAAELPQAPAEVFALLARRLDLAGKPEDALKPYRAYRAAGGTDAQILARLAEIEGVLAYNASLNAPNGPAVAPPPRPEGLDGLEARSWDPELPEYSAPAEAKVETLPDGNRVLRIDFKGDPDPKKDKAAVRRSLRGYAPEVPVLEFKVHNPNPRPLRMALAVKTGNYVYFESKPVDVQPSADTPFAQTVKFDLREAYFKSEESRWRYATAVKDVQDLKEMQLLVFNRGEAGQIYVDALGFVTPKDL